MADDDLVLNIVDEPVSDNSKKRKRSRNLKPSLQKLEALLYGQNPDRIRIKPHPREQRQRNRSSVGTSEGAAAPASSQTQPGGQGARPRAHQRSQRDASSTKGPAQRTSSARVPRTTKEDVPQKHSSQASLASVSAKAPVVAPTPSDHVAATSTTTIPAPAKETGSMRPAATEKRKRLPRRERFVNYEFKESDVFSGDSFSEMGLVEALVTHMKEKMNLDKPTHIQRASVPHLLEGKDVLVKAETGSGKTLAYLLPIVQILQALPTRVNRTEGSYAIVVAPTRELSLQIYEVLHKLVQPFHWIVPGIVMGGEKKKSEKARLRKGVTILVATPGRLLDHLQNTASFKVDHLRYLVLDEADRLLDMGFERDVKQIVKILDEKLREKAELAALATNETPKETNDPPLARQTALISATLSSEIKRLVGTVMRGEPVYVSVTKVREQTNDMSSSAPSTSTTTAVSNADDSKEEIDIEKKDDAISTPRGLDQSYAIVPCKKRLVTLAAFLQWQAKTKFGHWISDESLRHDYTRLREKCKLIVFTSNIASVEFLYTIYGRAMLPDYSKAGAPEHPDAEAEEDDAEDNNEQPSRSQQLLSIPLYKLHGDLSQVDRTKIYFAFCKAERGILFCTDVAARGLDLPAVNWIVQYDPPAEPTEYIHRVGRTARLGHCGRALIFLLPSEEPYAELLQTQYQLALHKVSTASILKTLPAPATKTDDFEGATLLQTHFEWMVKNDREGDLRGLAATAYGAFVRAYATHTASTKHIFHIKNLHLGHVAKSFALSEPPSKLYGKKSKKGAGKTKDGGSHREKDNKRSADELGAPRRRDKRTTDQPKNKKRRLLQMSEFAAF